MAASLGQDFLNGCIGGDKRPIFRTSLVSGNPDLTRGSDVFYYFSAGFLPFDEGSPARNGELALSAADWKVILTERRASRSQQKRKSHTPGGDRNWSNRELWNGQWFSSPSWGNIARDERYILHTIKTGNHWPLMAICHYSRSNLFHAPVIEGKLSLWAGISTAREDTR